MTCRWGIPKVDYIGFKDAIGLPNSEDRVSPNFGGISTGIVDDEGGIFRLNFEGVLDLELVSDLGFFDCETSSFCEDTSTFFGFSSAVSLS